MIPKRTSIDETQGNWLIGAVIKNPDLAGEVDDLDPEDLSLHDQKVWLRAIQKLYRSGCRPDHLAIAEQLTADGTFEDLGGVHEVMRLATDSPYIVHIDEWKPHIRKAAARRRLGFEHLAIGQMLDDPTVPADQIKQRLLNAAAQIDEAADLSPHAVVRSIADVEAVQLEWLWPGRIPLGKLTQIAGDPGLGKSFLTIDISARVSRGDGWPDNPHFIQAPGSVMIFNSEDDIGDTIRPRLEAASGCLEKIFFVEGVVSFDQRNGRKRSRQFSLDVDLPFLEKWLKSTPDARLIVIDPISAYCGATDTHRNSDVRSMLSPLTDLAARHRVAVVSVNHLTKGGGTKAVYRSMGSLAFNAAARAVWSVNRDLDDSERRLLLPAKMNLCKESNGAAYRIVDSRLSWEESPVLMTADDYLSQEATKAGESGDRKSARQEAIDFLREYLSSGPRPSKEVIAEAKEHGHTEKTVRRAFKDIGGKPTKSGFEGGWEWSLDSAEVAHEDAKMPACEGW